MNNALEMIGFGIFLISLYFGCVENRKCHCGRRASGVMVGGNFADSG